MKNYCYEFVRNYGVEPDLATAVDSIVNFLGIKSLKVERNREFAYERRYSNASEKQRYIINKNINDIYSAFLYIKLNHSEDNTNNRIMKKVLFGLWKYNNDEFNRFQNTVRDVFGLVNFNMVQFINTALKKCINDDILEDEKGVTLISKEIKPKWLDYFPSYDKLNNSYYELHIKFEYDLRKF